MRVQKVSLIVNGRKMVFSKEELSAIVEMHFEKIETIIGVPKEGVWFKIYPENINQKLFQNVRKDENQEAARQIILEAFSKMKSNPEKYSKPFETLMPEKTWIQKSVIELKEIASELQGHIADWVEQALEWAQRISNGETWGAVCNEVDQSNWYRVIMWKNSSARLVGGAERLGAHIPATFIDHHDVYSFTKLVYTVPLVARYTESII